MPSRIRAAVAILLPLAALLLCAAPVARADDLTYCLKGDEAERMGNLELVISSYDRCLSEGHLSAANQAEALHRRGKAYSKKGQYDRAIGDFSQAVVLAPANAGPYNDRGSAQWRKKQYALAVKDYEKAITVDATYASAYNNLAWLLATCPDAAVRDGARAVTLAEKAVKLTPDNAARMDTLAAAYAEAGRFEDAVRTQKQTIELMRKQEPAEVAGGEARLALYQQHKPFRE